MCPSRTSLQTNASNGSVVNILKPKQNLAMFIKKLFLGKLFSMLPDIMQNEENISD